VDAGWVWLAVISVVNSLVSVYYYFGVLVQMYMVEGTKPLVRAASRPALLATILIAVAATMLLGLFPAGAMDLARTSFHSLR
jgi:NADH:ubiquinone oxidoreductase subunit 2 (subunit N)